jgi:hypothetical protein
MEMQVVVVESSVQHRGSRANPSRGQVRCLAAVCAEVTCWECSRSVLSGGGLSKQRAAAALFFDFVDLSNSCPCVHDFLWVLLQLQPSLSMSPSRRLYSRRLRLDSR